MASAASNNRRPTWAFVVIYALLLKPLGLALAFSTIGDTLLASTTSSAGSRRGQQASSRYYDVPVRRASQASDGGDVRRSTSDNKAMSFLKKIGKVGGERIDFTNAIGVDEGAGGKATGSKWGRTGAVKKAKSAYQSCTTSGTIDDLSEAFPITSSGAQWAGVTDRVMGGKSSGTLAREEDFEGRLSNVLRAKVRLDNEGGFVQMATDLALDPATRSTVDASEYAGIELDVYYTGESEKEAFNVHLKTANCHRQFSSYRASFELPRGEWTTVRLPWSAFRGFGWGAVENALDTSTLRRIGIVAIGKAMDVTLALSSIRFIRDSQQLALAA